MIGNIKSLRCPPETNIILYTNDTSIKNKTTATKTPRTYGYKERMTMQMWKTLIFGDSGLYYSFDFSIRLKLFQNKKVKIWQVKIKLFFSP